MIDITTDLLDMLSLDDFAIEVLLPNGSKINALYDNEAVEIDNGYKSISSSQPILTCRTLDISTLGQGEEVQMNNTVYTVSDIQHNGTGVSEVFIKK